MFNETLETTETEAGFRCILYGESGYGKTYSLSTIPDTEGVGILSTATEKGLRHVKKLCPKTRVQSINSSDDMRKAFAWLSESGHKEFHTLFLDSLTDFAEIVTAEEKLKSNDPRTIYPNVVNIVFKMLSGMKTIPVNIIYTAHQGVNKMGVYEPDFPGQQLGPKAPYWSDAIFAMRMQEIDGVAKRAFQTNSNGEPYKCKFRGDELNTFEPPNWSEIYKKLGIKTTK